MTERDSLRASGQAMRARLFPDGAGASLPETGGPGYDTMVTEAVYPTAIQWGYGEIWHRPGLQRRERALVAVAAFAALKLGQVQKFGESALNVGLSKTEVIEAIVQTGPYSGFAPALNALGALSDVLR